MLALWKQVVENVGEDSRLWRDIRDSQFADAHLENPLRRDSVGSMNRQLTYWQGWEAYALGSNIPVAKPTIAQLLDFLHELKEGTLEDRGARRVKNAKGLVSAMAWVAKWAELQELTELMSRRVIVGLFSSTTPTDRREALPFPLAIVADWERMVCLASTPLHDKLFLGALLTMVWAGLRFGDIQRSEPLKLSVQNGVLRGLCWATKVTDRGQPFACAVMGASGMLPAWGWGHHYVMFLASFLVSLQPGLAKSIDYLLPDTIHWMQDGQQISECISRPMKYAKCLTLMRKFLTVGAEPCEGSAKIPVDKVSSYTIHGCKATSLSWACQLNVAENERSAQGHHRGSSSRHSVRLYGRDDVLQALVCQKTIMTNLHAGWRPQTAIGRGEQQPVAEPPCTIPTGTVPWETEPVPIFKCPFTGLVSSQQAVPILLEGDGVLAIPTGEFLGSDDDEDTEPEEDYVIPTSEDAAVHTPAMSIGEYYLTNMNRGTFHVVVTCEPSHQRGLTSPEFPGVSFRTACSSKPISWLLSPELPVGFHGCEGGCRSRLDRRRN